MLQHLELMSGILKELDQLVHHVVLRISWSLDYTKLHLLSLPYTTYFFDGFVIYLDNLAAEFIF